jgi:hypothetical protein
MKTNPVPVPSTGIAWTASEAASVNEFLNTAVGRKWLNVLASRKPKLDLSSTERAALTGAQGAGYESVLAVIEDMRKARSQPEDASAPGINPEAD